MCTLIQIPGNVHIAHLFPTARDTAGVTPATTSTNGTTTAIVSTWTTRTRMKMGNQRRNGVKGFDELIGMEFHSKTHHNIRKCSVHCDYCDKLQQSMWQKLTHHGNCSSGPNKDGALTRWCDQEGCGYSCRTVQSLNKHMATDHPVAIGLAVAKRWKCHLRGKEFKSPQGYKGHDCMTVKVWKPRKR